MQLVGQTLLGISVLCVSVLPCWAEPPNVIFFVMDDLNDWVTPLGYNQVKTPNLDRLAKSGVTFRNAHAPGVFCAPSRTAILTGMHASTTGCYENEVFHYDHPDVVTIQMAFKQVRACLAGMVLLALYYLSNPPFIGLGDASISERY